MSNGIGGTAPGRSARRKRFCARLASAILVLAVLFVAAPERVDAAYPIGTTEFSVTVESPYSTLYQLESAATWDPTDETSTNPNGVFTFVSYGRAYYNCSWEDSVTAWDSKMVQGQFMLQVDFTIPSVTGFSSAGGAVEILPFDFNMGIYNKSHCSAIPGSPGRAYISFYKICDRPQFGGYIDFKISTTFRAAETGANPKNITTQRPTVSISYSTGSGSAAYENWADLIDPNGKLLFDPTTGWLPTMNTNLQTIVTQTATANGWLSTMVSHQANTNSHLAGVRQNQQSQLANEATMIARQNEIIDNQETQINQLQVIVDYVSNTKAADIVEDANDTFVNNAGALESGQADLENAADASLAAVDFSKVGLISTFSQSVNWWMRCVNFLPTGTGAIWDVLVFGFLIAFVMFILRLVR